MEWFKSLEIGWQTAIFGAGVAIAIAVIGGLFKLLSLKKERTTKEPTETMPPPPPPEGAIHNLPYGSIGKLLKGRTRNLKSLHKQLSSAKSAAITQPATIHGLGGVGKTRLAVEYAFQSLNDKTYSAALFVIADSIFSLNTNLAALAAPNLLNLPEFKQRDQGLIVEAVIDALSRRNDWLLILDNVDDDASRQYIYRVLLPRLTTGRVLITSRMSNWPSEIGDLQVNKLDKKDAASYLRLSTKTKRSRTKNDSIHSEQLAEILDGLPVALEQAAAYINRMRITFDKYQKEFEKSRTETLARYETLVSYDSPTLFTWTSTQARLDPVAHTILRLASFLAPDPIPTALFQSQSDVLTKGFDLLKQEDLYQEIQPPDDELNIREALAELADWSMINLSQERLIVHRLVQDSVRLTIPSSMQKSWTELALKLIRTYIPSDPPPNDVRSWPLWTDVESHVNHIIQQASAFNIPEPTGWLMNSLGLYLKERIRFDEAEDLYRHVLALNEKLLGQDHPTVATCLSNLAQLLQDTNRLPEAEPLMRRALEIDEASFDPDHPKVAVDLNNLALLLQATNRLYETEPMYRRALKIDESSFGPDHPNVATDLNNLAQLLQDTNRLYEAEPLMRRALAIDESSFGPDHPNVAIDLNNLAGLLQATNRLSEAEPMYRRALKIDEASFGPDHPNVAIDLNNLAGLLQATNRLSEAEPMYRRALKIDEASFGPDHPSVARDLNNLAWLLKDTNRISEAESLIRRALKISEDSLGPDHPKTLTVRKNLEILMKEKKEK